MSWKTENRSSSKSASLKREIGLPEATAYGVGIILGAGIYALIGEAAGIAGNAVWISFAIGAVISSFTGLSYAELSSIFPKAAAEYVYVGRACGSRLLAFLAGWLIIFTEIVSAATVSLGFAGYFHGLFAFPLIPVAMSLIVLLSIINFYGIKESARTNLLFTGIEILGLLLIVALGVQNFGKVNYLEAPNGIVGILAASALIFFAYIGFEDVANIAEETKDPERNVPRALILSIVITTALYILVAFSVVSLANWSDLGASSAPLAHAASKALGEGSQWVMSLIALFATTNTVLILLVVGARMLYGMANEGSLPRTLARVHVKRRTPWIAVICMMIFSILFVLLGDIELIASITSSGAFITFALVNTSLIHLRYKEPELRRPFKVPINIGKLPILPLLGLISCLFMLFQFEFRILLSLIVFLVLGAIAYRMSHRVDVSGP